MDIATQNYLNDHVQRLQHDIRVTTRNLELEKRKLHTLDEDYRRAQEEFGEAKKNSLNTSARRSSSDANDLKKWNVKSRMLENRLEKALSKLNSITDDNLNLRALVDQHRRERLTLEQVLKKMQKDLQKHSGQLEDLKAANHEMKNNSSEAAKMIEDIRRQREDERTAYRTECVALQEGIRGEERRMKEIEVKQHREALTMRSSHLAKTSFIVASEEETFHEDWMSKRLLKVAFLNAIQRIHIKQHQKKVQVFEQAFATIKSSTGISDIQDIVKIFVTMEERSFSLLTYVNSLNRDIECIELRIREMKEQLDNMKHQEQDANKRKREVLEQVELQLEKTRGAAQQKEQEHNEQVEALEKIYPVVVQIAEKLERRIGQDLPMVEDHNCLPFLNYVERFLMGRRAQEAEAEGPPPAAAGPQKKREQRIRQTGTRFASHSGVAVLEPAGRLRLGRGRYRRTTVYPQGAEGTYGHVPHAAIEDDAIGRCVTSAFRVLQGRHPKRGLQLTALTAECALDLPPPLPSTRICPHFRVPCIHDGCCSRLLLSKI